LGGRGEISNTAGHSLAPGFVMGDGGIYVVWGEREEDGAYNWKIYFEFIPWT